MENENLKKKLQGKKENSSFLIPIRAIPITPRL